MAGQHNNDHASKDLLHAQPVAKVFTIKALFSTLAIITLLLLIVSLGLFSAIRSAKTNLINLQIQEKNLLAASEELRQSSADLTKLCRTFTATNGEKNTKMPILRL